VNDSASQVRGGLVSDDASDEELSEVSDGVEKAKAESRTLGNDPQSMADVDADAIDAGK
jgi:hypothetical protein